MSVDKVCSYSYFRHDASGYESENAGTSRGKFFTNFLPALVRAHAVCWKGWELRIHHDDRVRDIPYFKVLQRLEKHGLLRLLYQGQAQTLCGSMLWRLSPLFDFDVDYLVCRDIDSLPMPRDRGMVEEFIKIGATLHTINDSISHSGVMGGTCAFDVRKFRDRFQCKSLSELISRGEGLQIDYNKHGGDQLLLNGYVAPNICTDLLVHSMRNSVGLARATLPVHLRGTDADILFNHVGGAGDVDRAVRWYDANYPNPTILEAENGN